jgi:hypothetical protein
MFATGSNITNFHVAAFGYWYDTGYIGDLVSVYAAATIKAGTYTRSPGGTSWTKQ